MIKKCIICGKEFEPFPHLQKNQVCCCKECSTIFYKQQRKAYNQAHWEEIQAKQRAYIDKKHPRYCQICGVQLVRGGIEGKIRMHDDCIINKCVEYYKNGDKLPDYWKYKLYNRGFTLSEVKRIAGLGVRCLQCGKSIEGRPKSYCDAYCRYNYEKEHKS